MNRDQVLNFLSAINATQLWLPPALFQQIAGNPFCRTLEAIASGAKEFVEKSASDPAPNNPG